MVWLNFETYLLPLVMDPECQALTQNRTTPPKAVYDPRIVGNDMGLWVMGRTWIKFVEEAEEELQEYTCKTGNSCALLRGVAALAKGQASAAQDAFTHARQMDAQDVLPLLGLGTAAVVSGQDEEAVSFYQRVLEIEPHHKTAQRNLKILTDE